MADYNTKTKYKNIHYHLILLNYSKNKLKTHIHQYIKSSIISYYNFTYISMDSALEQYYSMLQELSLSKRKNSKEYNKSSALWYPLEIYKVYTSSGSFDHFITNKDDDLINSQYVRDNSIFLPLYETLSLDDVDKISKAFTYVIDNYDNDIEIFDERGYDEEINYFDGFYLMRKK